MRGLMFKIIYENKMKGAIEMSGFGYGKALPFTRDGPVF